ncbi:MAG: hypothetical protein CM1200mP20_13350 [Pseudomonadota bacterium]|nr:MAG: hypothetical protein CM1200mP20_13350 [Pseudomonadota bacterium]
MPLRKIVQGTSLGCWGWTTELPLMAKRDTVTLLRLNLWATLGTGSSETDTVPIGSI